MSGTFETDITEAPGEVAVPSDLDQRVVVVGCSSLGSGLSPFYSSGESARTGCGYGDAVDTVGQVIEQRQANGSSTKLPTALYTVPVTTTGSYNTIDTTGEDPASTVVVTVDASVNPYGTYDARFRVVQGGLVGVASPPILLAPSLDDGRTEFNAVSLGTASSLTIAEGNVKFNFAPATADLTALNTLINELFVQSNDHVVAMTDGLHGAADNDDVLSAGTYPSATNTATRIARVNAVRVAYQAHRIKIAGGVHNSADATNTIAQPVATDDSTALMLALDLKVKMNLHFLNSVAHTGTDTVNTVVSPDPVAGSFTTGDIIRVRTVGPKPSTADVDAAFVALAKSSVDFGILAMDIESDAAMLAHYTTGLNVLKAVGKRPSLLTRSRIPDFSISETRAAWAQSIADDMRNFSDSRICVDTAYLLLTDATSTRQYLRSDFGQFVADEARISIEKLANVPADQPEANAILVDSMGTIMGHDEGPRGDFVMLSNESLGNRFRCVQRLADQQRREDVFSTVPWVMYGSTDRIKTLPVRRIANAIEVVAITAGNSSLGSNLRSYPATTSTPETLDYRSQLAIQSSIFQALTARFSDKIQNADDAGLDGLVQVNPVVIALTGNTKQVNATIQPRVFGILLKLNISLAVSQ
jgi:hypothetical protein